MFFHLMAVWSFQSACLFNDYGFRECLHFNFSFFILHKRSLQYIFFVHAWGFLYCGEYII